jgi:hypothetical protein
MHILIQFTHGFLWGSTFIYFQMNDYDVLSNIVMVAFPLMVGYYFYSLQSNESKSALAIIALKQQEPGAYQIKIKENGKITATTEVSASIGGHSKLTGNLQALEKGQGESEASRQKSIAE